MAWKGKVAVIPAILAGNVGAHPIRGALACILSRHETEGIPARMSAPAKILLLWRNTGGICLLILLAIGLQYLLYAGIPNRVLGSFSGYSVNVVLWLA
jgi:hypothetical protein